ncbi:MAG: hypothetical protein LC754_13060 [Acidobacteria bacterium]|nr:hypothetical protein [Acidobacteriota bacterium]
MSGRTGLNNSLPRGATGLQAGNLTELIQRAVCRPAASAGVAKMLLRSPRNVGHTFRVQRFLLSRVIR